MSIKNFVTSQFANIAEYDPTTGEVIGITASGNVEAAFLIGDGSNLSNIQYANVVGSYSNANVANYLPTFTGDIGANTVTANYFVGNGALLTGLPAGYANSNVASYLPIYNGDIGANTVTANYFIGDGSQLSNIDAGNLIGAYGNANVANYLPTYTGVVAGTSANITDTVSAGNISVSGNISAGNVSITDILEVTDDINSTGTITGAFIAGDGSNLSNIQYANVVGAYGNSNVAVYLQSGNVTTDIVTTANISATGNVSGDVGLFNDINLNNAATNSLLYTDSNRNIYDTAFTYDAANDIISGSGSIELTGNVEAAFFIGDGSLLTNISGANIVGGYSNANVANYLPTNLSNLTANNISTYGSVGVGKVGDTRNITNYTATGTTVNFQFSGIAPGVPFAADEVVYVTNTGVTGLDGTYTVVSCTGFDVTVSSTFAAGSGFTTFGAQVTSTNLQDASVSGDLFGGTITSNGTLTVSGLSTLATVNASGNVTGLRFIGNGALLSNITGANVTGQVANALIAGTVYTAAQPNITSVGNLTSVVVTGNASAANFIGNGQYLSNIAGANVTGQVANALIAGTVYTAAQPNITSVGNLTSVVVTGNASAANFIGNGQYLSNIQYANIDGAYSNANVANYLPTYTGVITASDANISNLITTLGLSVTGDANIDGNLTVAGNIDYTNVNDLVVGDPLIFTGANNTSDIVDLGMMIQFNNGTQQYGGIVRDHTDSTWKFFANVANAPTTDVDFTNAIYAPLKAGYFIGDGSNISNITGANVTGQVANALIAGTVYTAAQPNITSVGNLTSVVVTGNASAANFIGNGQYLSNIAGANVDGQVANALIAGTVYTAAQPNITSVGNLTSVVVTGNASAANFIGNGQYLSNIQYANIDGAYSNANVANYLPTANVAILGTTITATLFSGNGSALTNLPYANAIVSGTSNITIASANGSIVFSVGGTIVGQLTDFENVNLGPHAGESGQYSGAIAIGANAGYTNQGFNAVAVGYIAGGDSQADNAIAIGQNAGSLTQGTSATAIGDGAGNYLQGAQAVAVGFSAGSSSQQADAIAIGTLAGSSDQGANAIAIGTNSGYNSQGANAIAIGLNAGVNQVADSIVINASGNTVDATEAGFYVAPVRNDLSNTANAVYFNTATNELTYAPVTATYGNAEVANYLPTFTGNISAGNIAISEASDLGNIANITIAGGTNGQVITTDGTGNLSFTDLPGSVVSIPAIYFTAVANGNGQVFSNAYLTSYTANTDITLFYNGSLLESSFYTLNGGNITINTPIQTGDSIDIIQQMVGNVNPLILVPRSDSVSSAATITPNSDSTDQLDVLALATGATFAAPSGSPVDAQRLTIRIKDNGVSQSLTWNAIYRAIGTTLPTATTASKVIYVGCVYNSQDSTWDVVSVATQA